MKRAWGLVLVMLALGTAIHLDWHAARHSEDLSLGWSYHWLLAVPVFGLTALYVQRAWPAHRVAASAAIILGAAFLGGLVEPCWEYMLEDASFDWAFGPARNAAFASFTLFGVAVHAAGLFALGSGSPRGSAAGAP